MSAKSVSETGIIEEDRSAKLGGSADTSAIITGDRNTATITITNYYYGEETTVVPTESTDAADEALPCPYRGLFHFRPNDAEVFFGREIFVEELYSATKTRNFIPVLGASGSGKSSVVLAGLVPKLQKEGHWQFTHFRPGSNPDPFYALAEALVPLYRSEIDSTDKITQASKLAESLKDGTPLSRIFSSIQRNQPNHRVLLIADQFEEIYTLCNDEEIRRKFLDCLLASLGTPTSLSSSATVLVTTMRADFLGNALSYPPFADLLRSADIKIRSMNREELSAVIEKPVQKLEVTFEAGLVERILKDVEDQPGNLPLLEFALTELWNKRTGKQLTHKIYEEIGQVEGALARHADEKYGNLTDEEKDKVRRIFIQLVRPGEGTEDTIRIAMKTELGEQSWSLVKQLADARLVVTSRNATSQETVEIVHEALIRNWEELREWMNKDRVFRAWQERLRSAKRQWEATNKDPGSLLRGAFLVEAEEELTERPEDLIAEKEFIRQSIQERDRLLKENEERRKLQLIAVSITSVVFAGLTIFASFQWSEAKKAKETIIESYINVLGELSLELENIINKESALGEIKVLDDDAWTTLSKSQGNIFSMFRDYGDGKVLVAGHEGVLSLSDSINTNRIFLMSAFGWLSLSSDETKVLISSGHCETASLKSSLSGLGENLRKWGYTVEDIAAPIDETKLSKGNILVIGNAWGDFTQDEIDAVENFVKNGGSLFAGGLGWAWKGYSDSEQFSDFCKPEQRAEQNTEDMSTYPMNRLVKPYKMQWTDEIIRYPQK